MAKKPLTTAEKLAIKNETKEAKFIRLATMRVGNTILSLRRLASLGGRQYVSTELQRKSIQTALTAELASTMDKLTGVKAAQPLFKL